MTLLKKYVYFYFSQFYWYSESYNFVISEDNLNFKNSKKAMYKLFLKSITNFFVQ